MHTAAGWKGMRFEDSAEQTCTLQFIPNDNNISILLTLGATEGRKCQQLKNSESKHLPPLENEVLLHAAQNVQSDLLQSDYIYRGARGGWNSKARGRVTMLYHKYLCMRYARASLVHIQGRHGWEDGWTAQYQAVHASSHSRRHTGTWWKTADVWLHGERFCLFKIEQARGCGTLMYVSYGQRVQVALHLEWGCNMVMV
jgi:hypothetical protein